jgi:hypothetical protein
MHKRASEPSETEKSDGSLDGETEVEDTLSTQIAGRGKPTYRSLLLLHIV